MYKIAIAEDKRITREGLRQFIDWYSIDTEVVGIFESGNSAIEYLQEHPVDIVLTDIEMDNGSGIDLAEYIHKKYPSTKIIIITAFENFKYAKKALELGVYAYVMKPINENEVLEKVKEAIALLEKESKKTQLISNLTLEQIAKDLQEFLEGSNSKLSILKQVLILPYEKTYYVAISIKSKDHTHISSSRCRIDFLKYFESVLTIRSNGFLTCVVLLNDKQQLSDSIMNSIYTSLYRNSRFCIGEIVSSIEEIQYSLRTSYLAYNDSFLHNTRGITRYEEILLRSEQRKGMDTYIEYSYLKNLLFQDKVNEFTDYIEDIFTTYRYNQVEQKYICNRCKETLKYLCDVLNEYLQYKSLLILDYTDIYDAVDLSELEVLFTRKVNIIYEHIKEKKNEKIRPIVKLTLEYSINNLKDSSLNLKSIASHFKVSYAYLSKAFKEDFDTSYTEYMNLYRIEMAKKQLLDSDNKVYEICEAIGLETKNFHYLFKKYEGITPKEFKAINQIKYL